MCDIYVTLFSTGILLRIGIALMDWQKKILNSGMGRSALVASQKLIDAALLEQKEKETKDGRSLLQEGSSSSGAAL